MQLIDTNAVVLLATGKLDYNPIVRNLLQVASTVFKIGKKLFMIKGKDEAAQVPSCNDAISL